ncbi:MAG: transcriptional repressor NrdR [Proteobacteria bacterium]|nr:transcriptional repressor NrdR [Pseudomonadota bacterium]
MRCPACGHEGSKVVDSRPGLDGMEIRRRRECEKCTHRFTTYERMEGGAKMVVKRDGRHEPFDRDKIRRSLRTACRKRPVSADAIARIEERVSAKVEAAPEGEVTSEAIGLQLLEELRDVDEISFARFASVYRRFESLADFTELAASILVKPDAD